MLMAMALALFTACGGGDTGSGAAPAAAAPTGSTAAPGAGGGNSAAQGAGTTTAAASDAAGSLRFTFTLAAERSTSAGIFTSDGRLLRTLWSGERLAAGSHTRSWDLRLDDGTPAPSGPVTVRLVHHNVGYDWQGVIGNTSFAGGQVPHRSFLPPASLAIDGDQVHLGAGYNEAQSSLLGFNTAQPQRPAARVLNLDPFSGFGLVASDGERLFAANTGGIDKGGFVTAFSLATGARIGWPQGSDLCLARRPDQRCYEAQNYPGVLARRSASQAAVTGLAVQRNGPVLAVAYAAENRIQLFDKASGRALNEIVVPLSAFSTNQLAISAAGDLWVAAADRVLRYTDLASSPRVVQGIANVVRPLALAGDPANDALLWVADGGSSQQLKLFDGSGTLLRRIGQPGGLQGRATVAPDRFSFQRAPGLEHAALALDREGRIWLADSGHNRLLRLATDGRLLDTVAWLPASYAATVDPSRPERVFANFLEYQVDHSLPPASPGAWTLVRNWLGGLPPELSDSNSSNRAFGGFQAVVTLGNGRTYGQLETQGSRVVVELTAAGALREVLRLPAPASGQTPATLHDNGDLGWAALEGERQRVYRRVLEGFDAQGNPRWAALPQVLASVPRADNRPWFRPGSFAGHGGPWFPTTARGQVLWLDPSIEGPDRMHLGLVEPGGTDWTWLASPSGPMDGKGRFQARAQDARLEYGANRVAVAERSIVYGYHGEFFTDPTTGRVGQANQFMHFLDNGLFMGQFGTPSTRAGETPLPGQAGNGFSWSLVRSGGRTFLLHNDESSWGGVHRWEILGLSDVQELNATGQPGLTLALR